MKKAIELRDYLTARVPHISKHPDKLHVLIEQGAIASRLSRTLSFEYRYDLTLIVLDLPKQTHADALMVPLLGWVAINQPNLMHNPELIEQAIQFKVDILDNDNCDIEIKLALTESVLVMPTDTGYTAEHLPEPAQADLTGPTGWEMFGNALPVLPTPLPDE